MTGHLLPVLIAVTLPALTGCLAGRRLGLAGLCVVQTACAIGCLAACSVRGEVPGLAAAAVVAASPWLLWLPAWQRRRVPRRLARLGDSAEIAVALARGGHRPLTPQTPLHPDHPSAVGAGVERAAA